MEDNLEMLCSLHFMFSRADDSYCVAPIKLLADGTIHGYYHPNEHSWGWIEGCLAFFHKDGKVSTLFDNISIENNKLIITGDYLLNPGLSIKHKLQQIDFDWSSRPRLKSLTRTLLEDEIRRYNWDVGDHSYGKPRFLEANMANVKIGKFCSIAGGVTIILGNHRMDAVTTYPFPTLKKHWPSMYRYDIKDHVTNGDVIIGNDVWIGFGATIMSGVTIGDGAVIAANSLVNHNVPPYAIVGGIPAKIIKMRHSSTVVESLLRIKWWEWDDQTIDTRLNIMLTDIDGFIKKYDNM